MNLKKGDLKPDLTINCTSGGAVVDLTTASSITVVGRLEGASSPLFSRAATGTALGVVTMPWQSGDTATVGRLNIEVIVTWPGTKPQRFPATSYLPVDILPNLS